MRKLLILLFVLPCLTSCKHSDKKTISTIDENNAESININQDIKPVLKLSDLLSEVIYIPLEETSQSLIGQIQNAIFTLDRIYVQDNIGSKILVFDFNGQFIYSIDRNGEGPGEYEILNQMTFDHERKQLILSSNRKIIWLDINGNFIREIVSPLAGAQGLHSLENSKLAFYMRYSNLDRFSPPHNLCITDSLGTVIQRALPIPSDFNFGNSTGLYNYFDNNNPRGLLTQPYSNDLLSFESSKIRVKYKLNFGQNTLPIDFDATVLSDRSLNRIDIERLELNKHYSRPFGIAATETTSHLHFTYRIDGAAYYVFYNKNSHQIHRYTINTKNDIGGIKVLPI